MSIIILYNKPWFLSYVVVKYRPNYGVLADQLACGLC